MVTSLEAFVAAPDGCDDLSRASIGKLWLCSAFNYTVKFVFFRCTLSVPRKKMLRDDHVKCRNLLILYMKYLWESMTSSTKYKFQNSSIGINCRYGWGYPLMQYMQCQGYSIILKIMVWKNQVRIYHNNLNRHWFSAHGGYMNCVAICRPRNTRNLPLAR